MKRQALLGLLALFLCISKGHAQGTPTFSSRVYVSGNGARVVFEPSDPTDALIEIYDAPSHRKIGTISSARRLSSTPGYDGKPQVESEGVRVEAVSTDGHYLLIRRMPPVETSKFQSPPGGDWQYNWEKEAFLEAWDISVKPHFIWCKHGVLFSDVKWDKGQIVVLLEKEVQRWNQKGEIVSRLSLAGFAIGGPSGLYSANTLSSDGSLAVISTDPPSVIETRKGRVLQKLDMHWPEQPVDFVFGPKNRYIWGHSLVVDEGFAPWDHDWIWSAMNGKIQKGSPQNPIFSPDGSAFWNDWNFRFYSIATGKPASLRAPAPFTNKTAFLQAISSDGRVWAGLTGRGEPFWVTTR